MKVTLDGRSIADNRELHELLRRELHFPEWYGCNLDALYDCLTDLTEDTEIEILHNAELEQALDGYAYGFFRVLRDAAEENPHITVRELREV